MTLFFDTSFQIAFLLGNATHILWLYSAVQCCFGWIICIHVTVSFFWQRCFIWRPSTSGSDLHFQSKRRFVTPFSLTWFLYLWLLSYTYIFVMFRRVEESERFIYTLSFVGANLDTIYNWFAMPLYIIIYEFNFCFWKKMHCVANVRLCGLKRKREACTTAVFISHSTHFQI